MTKHTGGEWGIATIDGGAGDDEIVTVVNGCTVSIASVFGRGEYSEARPNGEAEPHYEVSKEEAAANACLIAAAPKLLLALKELLEVADEELDCKRVPEMAQARAAIAKAEGR